MFKDFKLSVILLRQLRHRSFTMAIMAVSNNVLSTLKEWCPDDVTLTSTCHHSCCGDRSMTSFVLERIQREREREREILIMKNFIYENKLNKQ